MKAATVTEIIISHGRNKYQVNLKGDPRWFALMWGWGPYDGNIPSWKWVRVESVPKEVEQERRRLQ